MSKTSKEVQQKADAKRAGLRARGWACIVYPESVPENWIKLLNEAHIQTLISPLHDKDIDGAGKPKKPHYHVLAMFDNVVGESSAKKYFGRIGIKTPPEKIDTIKGYARYLIHLDDHDKAKYDESAIVALAGASWRAAALDEAEEINAILDEIEDYIAETGCVSYFALTRYARAERSDWTRVIRKNTIHLTALLKSLQWEEEQKQRQRERANRNVPAPRAVSVDLETGEILEKGVDTNGSVEE